MNFDEYMKQSDGMVEVYQKNGEVQAAVEGAPMVVANLLAQAAVQEMTAIGDADSAKAFAHLVINAIQIGVANGTKS
ncbi:hypothetical protein [Loigolactobacillus zhaoyuanensis]|uniref:Uncharacterized protein n=1 Tax=Loigolactobacillus zhaoyuanensis TaxID=2486017 RepID=A0ABW8U8B0_9LACO